MAGYDLNTAAGQAEFERRMASIIKNEVGSYTRTALSQSLGGVQQTQNNLDNTNLSIVPIGSIIAFGGVTLPNEFLWCDGSLIRKDKYARLFTVLGVDRYGSDTSDEFYLPNLLSRNPRGASSVNANVSLNAVNVLSHTGVLNHLQANTNANIAIADTDLTHAHNHDHNFNHGHSNNNAGQGATHNHAFQGATTSISRAAGNQAGLAAATHNHGFTGSTATHTHAHGLNSNNSNVGAGNSTNANALSNHTHNFVNGVRDHSINDHTVSSFSAYQTVNYIIKY